MWRRFVPGLFTDPGALLYVGAGAWQGGSTGLLALHKAGNEITVLEAWRPEIDKLLAGPRGHCVRHAVCGDVREIENVPLPHPRYDHAVWSHGPEHLPKADVAPVLASLEALADRILISCPYGEMRQNAVRGNPHTAHKSAWYPEEFQDLGYHTAVWMKREIVAWK